MRRLVMAALILTLGHNAASAQTIVAHRGASYDAPENTLASFRLAWEQGADAVEGDFHLTSDGRIVCIHDKTTERTTGVNLDVADATFEQLRQLDAGSWKDTRFAGEKIPTLDEVLATVPGDKTIYLELKSGPSIVTPLLEALQRRNLPPRQTCVISFDEQVVAAIKSAAPQLPVYWLVSCKQDHPLGKWLPTLDTILGTLKQSAADGLGTKANRKYVDGPFVDRLRQSGYKLNAWTVDKPEDIRWAASLGFDSITTNRPGFARDVLNETAQAQQPAATNPPG